MKTAIQNLTDEQIKNRAREIVRYQNFKSKIALEKMNCDMPLITFNSGVSYIKRGVINKKIMSKKLIEELDRCVEMHIQPLTLSSEEKRKIMNKKYQERDVVLPICKLDSIKTPIVSKFVYGIKISDSIKIMDSEKEARAFIQGAKFVEPGIELKLVELEYNIVTEEK